MQHFKVEEQQNMILIQRGISPLEIYSNGFLYFTVMMRGISQAGLLMFANYLQPDLQIKLPAPTGESAVIKPIPGETGKNKPEDALSFAKQIMESYFLKNAPSVFYALLEFISLAYSSNYELRKHIKNINAKYKFSFEDNKKQISLEIKDGRMHVFEGSIDLPDISVKFRDSDSLRKLLFTAKPDILEAILKQNVMTDGNLIYLFKLLYLIRHLQVKLTGNT